MRLFVPAASLAACLLTPFAGSAHAAPPRTLAVRTLDGSGNNLRHPNWGAAGVPYLRIAAANYADRIAKMASGPNARYISNPAMISSLPPLARADTRNPRRASY